MAAPLLLPDQARASVRGLTALAWWLSWSLKGAFGAFEARLDCPLRDQLTNYFTEEMKMPPEQATLRANEFMQRYLASADQTLRERLDSKARGTGQRRRST
jgi:hypothetical protein